MLSLTGAIGRVNPKVVSNALQGVVLVTTVAEEYLQHDTLLPKENNDSIDQPSLMNMLQAVFVGKGTGCPKISSPIPHHAKGHI